MRKTRAGLLATCFLAVCLVFNLSIVPPAMAEAEGSGPSAPKAPASAEPSEPGAQKGPEGEGAQDRPAKLEAGSEAGAKPESGGGVLSLGPIFRPTPAPKLRPAPSQRATPRLGPILEPQTR